MDAMIRHTVTFTLVHEPGSPEEQAFFEAARVLGDIPGVMRYEQRRQISEHSSFTFGISMEFEDEDAYDAYGRHPDHVEFVETRWQQEVKDFLELDFVAF
jgi:hypothetical protein